MSEENPIKKVRAEELKGYVISHINSGAEILESDKAAPEMKMSVQINLNKLKTQIEVRGWKNSEEMAEFINKGYGSGKRGLKKIESESLDIFFPKEE